MVRSCAVLVGYSGDWRRGSEEHVGVLREVMAVALWGSFSGWSNEAS